MYTFHYVEQGFLPFKKFRFFFQLENNFPQKANKKNKRKKAVYQQAV